MKPILFFLLLIILSCDSPKKTVDKKVKTTSKEIDVKVKALPENIIEQKELVAVLKNPDAVNSIQKLVTNSGLKWHKVNYAKGALKIVTFHIPAEKKDFWIEKLLLSDEFKSIQLNKENTIKNIIKANRPLFELNKTACSGDCPVYEISIDKNGKLTYNGIKYVLVNGKREFKLTDKQFKTFKDKLTKTSFDSYKKLYSNPKMVDLATTNIIYNNKLIQIKLWKDVPDELIAVTEYLDELLLAKKFFN